MQTQLFLAANDSILPERTPFSTPKKVAACADEACLTQHNSNNDFALQELSKQSLNTLTMNLPPPLMKTTPPPSYPSSS